MSDSLSAAPVEPLLTVRRQKRAAMLALSLMAAAPVVILAWDPLYQDMRVFSEVHACEPVLSEAQCRQLSAEATRRSLDVAPRYTDFSSCEADFARVELDCRFGSWCAADAVISCQTATDGLTRPPLSGFMVSESLLARLRRGEAPDLGGLDAEELQPVYGMPEEQLGYSGGYYYGGSGGGGRGMHLFNSQGQYLGTPQVRMVEVRRSFLSRPVAAGSSNHLPARFLAGNAPRYGGFGTTARASMARASG